MRSLALAGFSLKHGQHAGLGSKRGSALEWLLPEEKMRILGSSSNPNKMQLRSLLNPEVKIGGMEDLGLPFVHGQELFG